MNLCLKRKSERPRVLKGNKLWKISRFPKQRPIQQHSVETSRRHPCLRSYVLTARKKTILWGGVEEPGRACPAAVENGIIHYSIRRQPLIKRSLHHLFPNPKRLPQAIANSSNCSWMDTNSAYESFPSPFGNHSKFNSSASRDDIHSFEEDVLRKIYWILVQYETNYVYWRPPCPRHSGEFYGLCWKRSLRPVYG